MARVQRLAHIPRNAWIALALILVIGGGLRAQQATTPARVSSDARSYAVIAQNLADHHRYEGRLPGTGALHWPPATPALFALAYRIAPGNYPLATDKYQPIRWAQFVVSTLTILAVFVLGVLLAGAWPGVIAAGLIAFYPPLLWGPSNLLSEPLGALVVTVAFVAMTAAWRLRRWWWFPLTGALFGLMLLTRSDLLPVPFAMALLVLIVEGRRRGWARGAGKAALLITATAVVVAPWSIHASNAAGRFVPLTTGGGAAFFVGTYLPGNGNTVDLKVALRAQTIAKHPKLAARPTRDIPALVILDDVAARHPGMDRDQALLAEAKKNIQHNLLHDPIGFAGLLADKFAKLWLRSTLGGSHTPNHPMRIYHFILVLLAAFGLVAGLIRRRDVALGAILLALAATTSIHMLSVAHGRYNLPLMGLLVAGGVAGWWMLVEDRRAKQATAAGRPVTDPRADPPAQPDRAAPAPSSP